MTNLKCDFQAQAWVDDCAIDVDPGGETSFVVSDGEARRLTGFTGEWRSCANGSVDLDCLAQSSSAPAWIRNWCGPFLLHVCETLDAPSQPEEPVSPVTIADSMKVAALREAIDAAMARCLDRTNEDCDVIFQVLGGVKQALDSDYRVLDALP